MNRIEFMSRLSFLLSDITENEREEAVQYYNDYLDDAGVENEEEVLKALGRPEDLADSIRRGLLEESVEEGEFSETGYRETDGGNENEVACREAAFDGKTDSGTGGQRADRQAEKQAQGRSEDGREYSRDLDRRYRRGKKDNSSGAMSLLLILLCILIAPVAIPVIFAIALVLVILAAVPVFLAVVFLLVGIICIVAGVVYLFGSIAHVFTFPAGAIMGLGISLMTIGFGVLLTIGLSWVLAKVFPKAFRSAADFCRGLFIKKGENKG